jgi:hypothetical protein
MSFKSKDVQTAGRGVITCSYPNVSTISVESEYVKIAKLAIKMFSFFSPVQYIWTRTTAGNPSKN